MTTSDPLRLSVEDKLDVLRKLDAAGQWQSLDSQRYCTRCDHIISGRQIEVVGGTRAHGPLRLECPTLDCAGTPEDWINPGQRTRHAVEKRPSQANDGDPHHAGYVEIRAESEGISITHDGRAAVVRKKRSGAVVPLRDIDQLHARPTSRRGFMSWLVRNIGSVAADCRKLLGVLRPAARTHFHPVH